MSKRNVEEQKTTSQKRLLKEMDIYNELIRGFGSINPYFEIDTDVFQHLDRILDFGEADSFYCEDVYLRYAAHVLTLENGPKELWIFSADEETYADPYGDGSQYSEEMVERGRNIARVIGNDYPNFKGFANTPPCEPCKTLINMEYHPDSFRPDPITWLEEYSYFSNQLIAYTSKCAVVCRSEELREGVQVGKWISWAVEPSDNQVILGIGAGNESCHRD